MITYRGYVIELDFIYHDPYTKVPTGLVDGAYYWEDAEYGTIIFRQTLAEVKREIDEKIFENTHYRVTRYIPHAGKTITKFTWLTDHNGEMGALSFASKVNGEIEMYIGGFQEELSF